MPATAGVAASSDTPCRPIPASPLAARITHARLYAATSTALCAVAIAVSIAATAIDRHEQKQPQA